MSVNKLALNQINEDLLNIELELMDTLDYNSSKDDINSIVLDVSESIRQHLFFLVQKRVEEQAKLKKNVFSNFTQSSKVATNVSQPQVVNTSKPVNAFSSFDNKVIPLEIQTESHAEDVLDSASLNDIIVVLKKVNVLSEGNSYLPHVYRFKNSPYAYTIEDSQWSSPFGSLGESSLALVNDISNNVLKYDTNSRKDFVIKLAKAI